MNSKKNEINFDPAVFEPVRRIALEFEGAADSLSHYDTPSVKVKKNLLSRLNENGEWFVIRTDFESRNDFLDRYPESCFITSHFDDYAYICVDTGNYTVELLKEILLTGFHAIVSGKKSKKFKDGE